MRLLPLLLLACTPIPTSGEPLKPVVVRAPATAPVATAAPVGPQGDFDFGSDARPAEPATPAVEEDPLTLQARALGVTITKIADPPTTPQAALPGLAAPIWDPTRPLPDGGFGVRVLAVLLDLQPPRAVLGLPDGREQVVTPGAMLPAEGLVVLAIGRDAVQVAQITPSGFYARVDTQTIRALFPQSASSGP